MSPAPESDALANEWPGLWTVGCGAVAASIFIAAVVNAVVYFALPSADALLALWAIVGPLGGAVCVVVRGWPRPVWLLLVGFLTGAVVPVTLRMLGVMTESGLTHWTDYLTGAKGLVLAGMAGTIFVPAFVRLLARRNRAGRVGVALLTMATVAGLCLAPFVLMTRSCHNPSRNSARPVPPVTEFEIHVAVADWALLQHELVRFAHDGGWKVWSNVRADPSYPWFEASVCRETGTDMIFLLNAQKANTVELDVYQPQGGNGWEQAAQAMKAYIDNRWPGSFGQVDSTNEAFTPSPPRSPKPRKGPR